MSSLFVLFDACSVGLFHEYSPLLKNLFLIFFHKRKTDLIFPIYKSNFFCYKTDLILFNTNQKPIFLVLKNRFDIFLKPKDFVLFNKHRFDFSLPKLIFFMYIQKQI